jgi:hypothetical protein
MGAVRPVNARPGWWAMIGLNRRPLGNEMLLKLTPARPAIRA